MQALAIDAFGEPATVRDLPMVEPEEGQLRLRVATAGLNPFDVSVVQGNLEGRMEHRFPLIPGMDAAGTVDALGAGVDGYAIGERAFGSVGKPLLGAGTVAEFVTVSGSTVTHTPGSVDDDAAAALPTAGVTALVMADALGLVDGRTVVAVGATGGVGGYFIQLAKHRGASVVAVCRGENAAYARSLGADDVIDYTAEDVVDGVRSRHPEGIHAIADLHGDAEQLTQLSAFVSAGGHVVSAVGAADVEALAAREIEGTNVMGLVTAARLETLLDLVASGDLVAPEIHRHPLAGAAEALAAVGSGHVRGKIVVQVGS